jgi:hypothetical protein
MARKGPIYQYIGNTAVLDNADARTIVWVILADNGPDYVVSETAGLFCPRNDPLRSLAMGGIPRLFEIAWVIRDKHYCYQQARDAFFGYELESCELRGTCEKP